MKIMFILLLVIVVFILILFVFNFGVFFLDNWIDSYQDVFVVQQKDEVLSMLNILILDIGIMVSDDMFEIGVVFIYIISYLIQSFVEDVDNLVIEVFLFNGIQVVSFVGNVEVGSIEIVNVMGMLIFCINMKNLFEVGVVGIFMLELVILFGQVCDGIVIFVVVIFLVDDVDNSFVSDQIDIIVSVFNEEWNVNVNVVIVGVFGFILLF